MTEPMRTALLRKHTLQALPDPYKLQQSLHDPNIKREKLFSLCCSPEQND